MPANSSIPSSDRNWSGKKLKRYGLRTKQHNIYTRVVLNLLHKHTKPTPRTASWPPFAVIFMRSYIYPHCTAAQQPIYGFILQVVYSLFQNVQLSLGRRNYENIYISPKVFSNIDIYNRDHGYLNICLRGFCAYTQTESLFRCCLKHE